MSSRGPFVEPTLSVLDWTISVKKRTYASGYRERLALVTIAVDVPADSMRRIYDSSIIKAARKGIGNTRKAPSWNDIIESGASWEAPEEYAKRLWKGAPGFMSIKRFFKDQIAPTIPNGGVVERLEKAHARFEPVKAGAVRMNATFEVILA